VGRRSTDRRSAPRTQVSTVRRCPRRCGAPWRHFRHATRTRRTIGLPQRRRSRAPHYRCHSTRRLSHRASSASSPDPAAVNSPPLRASQRPPNRRWRPLIRAIDELRKSRPERCMLRAASRPAAECQGGRVNGVYPRTGRGGRGEDPLEPEKIRAGLAFTVAQPGELAARMFAAPPATNAKRAAQKPRGPRQVTSAPGDQMPGGSAIRCTAGWHRPGSPRAHAHRCPGRH
jgi:hypothetical protein